MSELALDARLEAIREEAEQRDPLGLRFVEALRARAVAASDGARERLLRRADAELSRLEPRVRAPLPPTRPDARALWRDRLAERARARGARGASSEIVRDLFRDSVGDARAAIVVARAREGVPEAAGPYHGSAIAAELLGELAALSPSYVRALLGWLDDIAALQALPAEPAPRSRRGR